MEFLNNYLFNIKQSPKDYYHDLNQATVNHRFEDTTQIRTVKEQMVSLHPFEWLDEYREYEAWVDTVSDLMVQYNKVYSDFIEVLPKDVDHPQNYRGQYYKLALDNENEETYLCYDTINNLEQLPNFKLVRCNNVLTMIDKNNKIKRYPCYLGVDISSTNDYVAKSGIIPNSRMIVMIQVNEDTKTIVNNQRFMFEHKSCYEIEEINDFMQEEGTNGTVTIMRLYVKYTPLMPRDNTELNLCDYYMNEHEITEDEPITTKTLVVDPIRTTIKEGDTLDINVKVIDDSDNVLSQDFTYSCNWEDNEYYTITKTANGLTIENIQSSDEPLYITIKSDGCEDVNVDLWLVYLF